MDDKKEKVNNYTQTDWEKLYLTMRIIDFMEYLLL